MTMPVTDLVDSTRRIEQEADAQQAAAAAEQAEAEQARAEAEQRASAAAAAALAARRQAGRRVRETLQALTAEVRAAREEAVSAVHTGEGDPLALWLAYRRLNATNRGRWDALGEEYRRVTGGSEPPPGNWGPQIIPAPELGLPSPETFDQFLTAEVVRVDQASRSAAKRETIAEIRTARQVPS
jgi:multidrug efflux pump subunit AcrA (membrane-fusion protein)